MIVGLLHPGNMGSAIGAQLTQHGHTVLWDPRGRSTATADRATHADLQPAELTEILTRAEIVLSVCPSAAAEEVAELVREHHYTGTYVDANAVSRARMIRINDLFTDSAATVVDAAICGPPPRHDTHPRIYLAGPQTATQRVHQLLTSSSLDTTVLSETIGAASILKITVASYMRTVRPAAALAHALADEYGITDALVREAEHFGQKPLADRDYLPSVAARAWRWETEMEDLAHTLHEVGLPTHLAQACAQLYHLWAPDKDHWSLTPEQVLARLKQQQP